MRDFFDDEQWAYLCRMAAITGIAPEVYLAGMVVDEMAAQVDEWEPEPTLIIEPPKRTCRAENLDRASYVAQLNALFKI
jgi:hypothetical protein